MKRILLIISLVIEEIFPQVKFLLNTGKIEKKLKKAKNELSENSSYKSYLKLNSSEFDQRISEERARATALNEKTFKLTFSLSAGLSVLGLTTATLVQKIHVPWLSITIGVIASFAVFYTLSGGFIAVGAMRTQQTYGYGTLYMIQIKQDKNKSIRASALSNLEDSNLKRHLRNEAAYQCLRNGFVCLSVTLILFAVGLVLQIFICNPSKG